MVLDMAKLKVGDWVRCTQRDNSDARMLEVGKTYNVAKCYTYGLYVRDERGAESNYLSATQFEQIHNEEEEEMANKDNIKVGDFAKVLKIEETSNFKVGETYIVSDVDEDREIVCLRTNDNRCFRWFDTGKVKKQVIAILDADAEEEEGEEMVHHPKHYERNDGSMETIQYMETIFGTRALITYCIINSFKYRDRAPFKGKPVEDNEKCGWYLKKAEELASKLGTDAEEFPLDAL